MHSGDCWNTYQTINGRPKGVTERLQRRRASLKRRVRAGRSGRATAGRWRRICERDGFRCWLCDLPIDPTLTVPDCQAGTADHVISLVEGGTDDDANLRAAHFGCNSRRGARLREAT